MHHYLTPPPKDAQSRPQRNPISVLRDARTTQRLTALTTKGTHVKEYRHIRSPFLTCASMVQPEVKSPAMKGSQPRPGWEEGGAWIVRDVSRGGAKRKERHRPESQRGIQREEGREDHECVRKMHESSARAPLLMYGETTANSSLFGSCTRHA